MHKYVCISLFLSLGYILRLASEYISKQESRNHVHQPGTETPGTLVGLHQLGRRNLQDQELLEAAVAYNIS